VLVRTIKKAQVDRRKLRMPHRSVDNRAAYANRMNYTLGKPEGYRGDRRWICSKRGGGHCPWGEALVVQKKKKKKSC